MGKLNIKVCKRIRNETIDIAVKKHGVDTIEFAVENDRRKAYVRSIQTRAQHFEQHRRVSKTINHYGKHCSGSHI